MKKEKQFDDKKRALRNIELRYNLVDTEIYYSEQDRYLIKETKDKIAEEIYTRTRKENENL